jgi:hypothetical protein
MSDQYLPRKHTTTLQVKRPTPLAHRKAFKIAACETVQVAQLSPASASLFSEPDKNSVEASRRNLAFLAHLRLVIITVAEALLAFGVAANIVQFIDFTAKVISIGYYTGASRYGGLNGIDLVRNVNDDLRNTVNRLERSLKREQRDNNPTENQKELLNLAEQCRDVAAELFMALESLKVRANE